MNINNTGALTNHLIEYLTLALGSEPSSQANPTNAFSPANGLTALRSFNDQAWDELTILAIALGLAPLLHWHLEQKGLQPPPMAMARLALTRQAHRQRNQAIAHQLAEILAACHQQNIPVLVLKGALLAPLVYPDPALRPMNDIDLLFQPQDLPRVDSILTGLGYLGKHKRADQGPGITKHLSTYRRPAPLAATPNPYLSPASDRTVEPHSSLEESWFGLKVDITPGVWQRAIPVCLYGQPAYRLSTVDLLLHLAVHAVFHLIMGSSVFLQLYDLGQVVRTWANQVDWSLVIKLSQNNRAEPFVYAALYWSKTIFKTPLPETPLAELARCCPSPLRTYVQALDAVALFRRTQQPPLVSLSQRLRRGLQDRREAARWAASLTGKWRVWQTVLAFHKTDTVQLLKQKVGVQR